MPVPPNTTPATAIDLIAPQNYVERVDDGAVTYPVWFKHTVVAGDQGELGLFGVVDLTWNASLAVYDGQANAIADSSYLDFFLGSAVDVPVQIPEPAIGSVLYFKFVTSGGAVLPVNLTVDVQPGPNSAIPQGTILINDHDPFAVGVDAWPLVLINHSTGAVLKFVQNFSCGNYADILASGASLWEDVTGPPFVLRMYDTGLNVTHTVTNPFTDASIGTRVRTNQTISQFYIGNRGLNPRTAKVRTVDTSGNVGATIFDFGSTAACDAFAPNNDETILYYGSSSAGTALKRWNLSTNAAMADLVAGIANYKITDIVVLKDGSICVCYDRAGVDSYILRYDATGALLSTYNTGFGSGSGGSLEVKDLAYATDDPTSFWCRAYNNDNATCSKIEIKVSDGSHLNTATNAQFETGISELTPSLTPTRFGHSDTCAFLILQQALVVPTGTIVVTKVDTLTGDTSSFPFGATNLTPSSFSLQGGQSRTFSSVPAGSGLGYGISETPPPGWTVQYAVSNSSPINDLTVTAGETTTVTVTDSFAPASITYPMRRLRQFIIPSSENFWLFLRKIEFELQRGVGLESGQGSDPTIMFQLSRDGGKTWGPEHWVTAGKLGEYTHRAIIRKLGRARNPVGRIVVSDPVFWALQDAYFEGDLGSS